METILNRIIVEKQKEIAALKAAGKPAGNLKNNKKSLIQKLQNAEEVAIIAEFKRASPSKGMINEAADPAAQAALYEKYGASAISVLTDHTFFKGSFSDLAAVREAVTLPILCKDFIIDPIQIDYAAANGADIILLIVAALEENQLLALYQYAKSQDLEVLVEVHQYDELERALKTGAKVIGLNNRDLKTFRVSLDVTEELAGLVKQSGAFLISESGIHVQSDVERVRNAGANGILVGEALMKTPDVSKSFQDFRLPFIIEGAKK